MAIKQLITLAALLVICINIQTANAQIDVPGPRFSPKDVETAEATRPLASPGVFRYDAQMFAPLEFPNNEQLGGRTGFFATYDRLYTSMSRGGDSGSGSSSVPVGNYYIWGNRFNVGWMNDNEDGWSIEYSQSEGSTFSAGRDVLVGNPFLTNTKFANVEVNRIFRQNLSRGGWVEPYFGVRYINLNDNTLEDTIVAFTSTSDNNRFKQTVTNDSIGAHVGGAVSTRRGRWRWRGDLSLAAMYNQQTYFATDIVSAAGPTFAVFEFYDANNSFMPVVDTSLEVGYNITRDFGLRGGVNLIYMWNGVARANTLTTNANPNSVFGFPAGPAGIFEERLLTAGFSFGFEWRR